MADEDQQRASSPLSIPLSRRRLFSLTAAAGVGAVGVSALSACAPGSGSGLAGSTNTIRAAIGGEPDQLDPHKTTAYFSFEVLENVFDTLVEPNEKLEMVPALAQSWQVNPDETQYTFTLRPDVRWHNGEPFTAADVVYSYRRIIDGELSASWRFDNVASIEAPDDAHVVITTHAPSPNLLSSIGGFKGLAIVNKRNVESGQILSRPIGTGPFSFESRSPATSIVLKANPGHWSGGPHVDGVAFSFISQGTTAVSALRSGEVDWTDAIPTQQLRILDSENEITVGTVTANDYWYVAMNFARKPFDDRRVRQAVAYAIDRKSIAQVVGYGTATPNQLAIPKTSPWFTPYDRFTAGLDRAAAVDKARSLLRDAGHSSLSMGLMVSTEYPETITAAQVIASNLADAGIKVSIEQLDFGVWLDRQSAGQFDSLLMGWLGNIDPDDFYYAQHHTGGTSNSQKYSNPEVDRLLDAGRTELDVGTRKQIYTDVASRIADDVSYLYLYNPSTTQAFSTSVRDYTVRADKAVRFRDARLDRGGES